MKRIFIPLFIVLAASSALLLSPNVTFEDNVPAGKGSSLEQLGGEVFHALAKNDPGRVEAVLLTPTCAGVRPPTTSRSNVCSPGIDPMEHLCAAARDTLLQFSILRAMPFDWSHALQGPVEYHPVFRDDIQGAYVLLTAETPAGDRLQVRLKCVYTGCGWKLAGMEAEVV